MKKVYIPTMDELYFMQSMGVSIYHYLLSKTIKSLVMVDVVYEEEDMFDIAYEELYEYPEIIYSIAKMYPEKISSSEIASQDVELCRKIIPILADNKSSIQGLDYMTQFSSNVLKDPGVIKEIISTLANKLQSSPRYRFEYQGPNDTLDSLFACEILKDIISGNTLDEIICIEPAYLVKVNDMFQTKKSFKELESVVIRGSTRYACRYRIDAYPFENSRTKDVLTNPTERVKKLIRVLDIHRQYYKY